MHEENVVEESRRAGDGGIGILKKMKGTGGYWFVLMFRTVPSETDARFLCVWYRLFALVRAVTLSNACMRCIRVESRMPSCVRALFALVRGRWWSHVFSQPLSRAFSQRLSRFFVRGRWWRHVFPFALVELPLVQSRFVALVHCGFAPLCSPLVQYTFT